MTDQEKLDPIVSGVLEDWGEVPARDPRVAVEARNRFLHEAARLVEVGQPVDRPDLTWRQRLRARFGRNHVPAPSVRLRLARSLALLALVGLLLGGTALTASAAQRSLPGDPLYSVKTYGESARLAVTFDRLEAAQLHLKFAERRLTEVEMLLALERGEDLPQPTRQFETHLIRAAQSLVSYAGNDAAARTALAQQISASIENLDAILAVSSGKRAPGKDAVIRSIQPSNPPVQGMDFELTGEVQSITDDLWMVGGFEIRIIMETQIDASIQLGDIVEVSGSLGVGGDLIANSIKLADVDEDENEEGEEFEFTGVVEAITPDSWVVSGRVVELTEETRVEEGIQPGDFVKVEALRYPDGRLVALEIEQTQPDDDDGEELDFRGVVEMLGETEWVISGRTVLVSPETEIEDKILVGDMVEVEAILTDDGLLWALSIELVDDEDDGELPGGDDGPGDHDDDDDDPGDHDDDHDDDPGDHDDDHDDDEDDPGQEDDDDDEDDDEDDDDDEDGDDDD